MLGRLAGTLESRERGDQLGSGFRGYPVAIEHLHGSGSGPPRVDLLPDARERGRQQPRVLEECHLALRGADLAPHGGYRHSRIVRLVGDVREVLD